MNQYHHLNFLLHNCQWSLDQWHLLPLQTRGWRCSHRFSPILVFSCICKLKKEQISGVSLWKHVWSGWERFPKHARFIVEVGIQSPFWHVRCVDVCLKSPFPDLFALSVNKGAIISEHIHWKNGMLHWCATFSHALHDLELEFCIELVWVSL